LTGPLTAGSLEKYFGARLEKVFQRKLEEPWIGRVIPQERVPGDLPADARRRRIRRRPPRWRVAVNQPREGLRLYLIEETLPGLPTAQAEKVRDRVHALFTELALHEEC